MASRVCSCVRQAEWADVQREVELCLQQLNALFLLIVPQPAGLGGEDEVESLPASQPTLAAAPVAAAAPAAAATAPAAAAAAPAAPARRAKGCSSPAVAESSADSEDEWEEGGTAASSAGSFQDALAALLRFATAPAARDALPEGGLGPHDAEGRTGSEGERGPLRFFQAQVSDTAAIPASGSSAAGVAPPSEPTVDAELREVLRALSRSEEAFSVHLPPLDKVRGRPPRSPMRRTEGNASHLLRSWRPATRPPSSTRCGMGMRWPRGGCCRCWADGL